MVESGLKLEFVREKSRKYWEIMDVSELFVQFG